MALRKLHSSRETHIKHFESDSRRRSTVYSRQSHIRSFWRCGMERPAGSRHCCAVTRGLQTAPQDISVSAFIA